MNIVVVLMEHAPQIVLENFVYVMATAHQANIVVLVVKVYILASVLNLVLENRVRLIPTVAQVNIVVVLIEHAP